MGFRILKGKAGDMEEKLSCIGVINECWMRATGIGMCFQRSPSAWVVEWQNSHLPKESIVL